MKIPVESSECIYYGDGNGNPQKAQISHYLLIKLEINLSQQHISGQVRRCAEVEGRTLTDPKWRGEFDIYPRQWQELLDAWPIVAGQADASFFTPHFLLTMVVHKKWIRDATSPI